MNTPGILISREEAFNLGLKRYYDGKPCQRGHLSERYANDHHCVACKREGDWKRLNHDRRSPHKGVPKETRPESQRPVSVAGIPLSRLMAGK